MSRELELLRNGLAQFGKGAGALGFDVTDLRAILRRMEAAERVAYAAWAYHATQPEQSVRTMRERGDRLDDAIRAYRALDAEETQ